MFSFFFQFQVMSLKLWLILYTVRDTCKFVETALEKEEHKTSTIIRNYVKQLLKMKQTYRIRPNLERYLRNAIQAFPYHHCLLFQALIKNLAAVEFVSKCQCNFLSLNPYFM